MYEHGSGDLGECELPFWAEGGGRVNGDDEDLALASGDCCLGDEVGSALGELDGKLHMAGMTFDGEDGSCVFP